MVTSLSLTASVPSFELVEHRFQPAIDWQAAAIAWLVEVHQRTGSNRTPTEYGRYVGRFLLLRPDPTIATLSDVHSFGYGSGPSGKQPGLAAIIVRFAALRGYCDFCRRMDYLSSNHAHDVKTP
jgi:hypothetical protein